MALNGPGLQLRDVTTAREMPSHTPTAHSRNGLQAEEIRQGIERLRVRVQARQASPQSLGRAALGVETIRNRLVLLMGESVNRHGWTAENRLARSAVEAMDQQLDQVLQAGHLPPKEKCRDCLDHALTRALDAATLLGP